MNQVKKEILNHIEEQDGAFFGRIAQQLRFPNRIILKNLMELKLSGIIYKDNDGGRYKVRTSK